MKKDPYRLAWVVVFVTVGFIALGGMSRFFGGGKEAVVWREDLEEGKKEAAAQRKPVFLYFTAGWCGPCQQMKRTTWADEKVAGELARGFVAVKIDVDRQTGLAREFNVESIPWMGLLDGNGKVVKVASGAMGSDEFLSWLKAGQ